MPIYLLKKKNNALCLLGEFCPEFGFWIYLQMNLNKIIFSISSTFSIQVSRNGLRKHFLDFGTKWGKIVCFCISSFTQLGRENIGVSSLGRLIGDISKPDIVSLDKFFGLYFFKRAQQNFSLAHNDGVHSIE